MKVRTLIGLGVSLAAAALAGCGGGGGGGGAAAPSSTVISGMASKGPINGGTVKVYAIRSGTEDRSAPLGQGQTDAGGKYTVDVGAYKGAVLVEVTGGSYADEVTGALVALKAAAPLRAVFANASTGKKTVAVTPLTELAYKKAKGGGAITPAAIDDANKNIATFFKLADIISTEPVASGDDNQKKYAFVLGSFAQLINDNKKTGEALDDALPRLLTQIGDEMEHGGGLSPDTIGNINDAITNFTNSGRNQTGATITPIPAPTSGIIKLSSTGTTNTIGAIDLTVNFPAGVRVNADATTGEAASGAVTISGVAAVGDNKLTSAKFTPAAGDIPARLRIVLINTAGFGLGEFATIRFDLAGGSFPAGKEAFSVASFAAKDLNGTPLGNITAAPASVGAEVR